MIMSNDISPTAITTADRRSEGNPSAENVCESCGGSRWVCEVHPTQLPNHIMPAVNVFGIDLESRHRSPERRCRAASASCPECDPDGPLPLPITWF